MDDLPPRPQDPAAIDRLVQTLREGAERKKQKDGPFSCRCTAFRRANTPELESWKFAEWDFKRPGLPTYARGLFTARTGTEPHYEIVARGYDKFFSVGEVEDTQWRNIETRTRGPYEISQKENGCIIFISGLADGSLLVCSKHSTGPRPGPPPGQKSESESKQTTPAAGDTTVPIEEQLGKLSLAEATAQTSSPPVSPSHAEVGERWVHKHVASVGRTAADLARTLRALNLTAVGELCDDAFEEHVLPYAPERAGIYLHGLNYNLPEFATLPGDAVHAFADAWGFRKAQFLVKQTLAETREFLERCAETGSWNGRETEGFVVRCKKMQAPERDVTPPAPDFAATAAPAAPAAPAYTDWFFKYKFEEPYLMYRHWRECTMTLLSGGEPKVKKHPDSTRRYLQYVRRQLDADPGLADRYLHHRGIIALRDGFLREVGQSGAQLVTMEAADDATAAADATRDIVLVTVATLGCGKTTVATALGHLFGWAHVQNDNIRGAGRPRRFADQVLRAMATHPVTIADRNNHQRRERRQLIDDARQAQPAARFVALHWVHEPKGQLLPSIRKVTRARVLERGDNHQTIQASSQDPGKIIGIMEGFLGRFEGVDTRAPPDDDFDLVIDLDPRDSSRASLEKVVTSLREHFPALMRDHTPTAADLDDAIEKAIKEYAVSVGSKHELTKPKKSQQQRKKAKADTDQPAGAAQSHGPDPISQLVKRAEFFHVMLPPDPVRALLTKLFPFFMPANQIRTYRRLLESGRIQPAFHVTLIHQSAKKEKAEVWQQYCDQLRSQLAADAAGPQHPTDAQSAAAHPPALGKARVKLEKVVWDDCLMCFTAQVLPYTADGSDEPSESTAWPCANAVAHVTVGTVSPDIKPRESNDLLQRFLQAESETEHSGIQHLDVPERTILDGTVSVHLRK